MGGLGSTGGLTVNAVSQRESFKLPIFPLNDG
jgi:hypothetical protein